MIKNLFIFVLFLLMCQVIFAGLLNSSSNRKRTVVITSSGPSSTTNGLISYWPFTGNANDTVGSYNLLVTGALLTNGISGAANTAYWFDGNDDSCTNGAFVNMAVQTGITMTAWFRPEATDQYAGMSMGSKEIGECNTRVNAGSMKWQGLMSDASESEYYNTVGNDTITITGRWYHVVGVYTNGLAKLYIDGIINNLNDGAAGTVTFAEMAGDYSRSIFVGRNQGTVPQFFDGRIDEVRFYNRCLSSNEVYNNYIAEKSVMP
jgi:hypothetical protein